MGILTTKTIPIPTPAPAHPCTSSPLQKFLIWSQISLMHQDVASGSQMFPDAPRRSQRSLMFADAPRCQMRTDSPTVPGACRCCQISQAALRCWEHYTSVTPTRRFWENSLGNFHLRTRAWPFSLGIFRLVTSVLDLSLENLRSEAFVLGGFAWKFGLGSLGHLA